MQTILNWIIKQVIGSINQVYAMFINSSTGGFSSNYVIAIMKIFSMVTVLFIGIAFGISIIHYFTGKMEDKDISPFTIIKNGFIGLCFSFVGFDLAKILYFIGTEFSKSAIAVIQWVGNIELNSIKASEWVDFVMGGLMGSIELSNAAIVTAVLSIAIMVILFKNLFDIIKRFGVYLLTTLLLPLYIFEYVTGDTQALTKWMKQLGAILVTHIFQMIAINLGIAMLSGTGNDVIPGFGILLASGLVEKICSNWGFGTKTQGANIMGKVHSAMLIKNMFVKG